LLSGTFELFPLAEVLGLIERAAASGALVVRGREIDGTLYFVEGALCAGEIGDLSGPVEGQQALEIRPVRSSADSKLSTAVMIAGHSLAIVRAGS
jgi:hypothetical protein